MQSEIEGTGLKVNPIGLGAAILILAAFCQPIVIIFHEIAIYCADRGQNENCWAWGDALVNCREQIEPGPFPLEADRGF
jgi:hypothetical protein